jgi:hypothetical protein
MASSHHSFYNISESKSLLGAFKTDMYAINVPINLMFASNQDIDVSNISKFMCNKMLVRSFIECECIMFDATLDQS